jgi:hypothetical protein
MKCFYIRSIYVYRCKVWSTTRGEVVLILWVEIGIITSIIMYSIAYVLQNIINHVDLFAHFRQNCINSVSQSGVQHDDHASSNDLIDCIPVSFTNPTDDMLLYGYFFIGIRNVFKCIIFINVSLDSYQC